MNAYELTLHEMLAHGFISYRDVQDMADHCEKLRDALARGMVTREEALFFAPPRPVPLMVVYRDE